ncbi:MAG: hypothetical protein P4L51_21115 [Puia sp.]|nr:hypothetical protein [Puia sp.]
MCYRLPIGCLLLLLAACPFSSEASSSGGSGARSSGAEELNGIWKGSLTQEAGGCYPRYSLELQIHVTGDRVEGIAYDYFDATRYVRMDFTGRYNPSTHSLVLIENKVIQANLPADCIPCLKTYYLTYSPKGAEEMLSGDWKGHILERSSPCPPGKIFLKKGHRSDFPVDIEQSDTLIRLQQTLRLQPRPHELLQTILVDSPRLKIDFFDNAEIDNDTITVLINNKLVLYRQGLTDKPVSIELNAFPHIEYELVMYADNLGTIPPNTALMVVKTGTRRIELFLSSGTGESAAVKFMYKPD